jgi:hypothetical protein
MIQEEKKTEKMNWKIIFVVFQEFVKHHFQMLIYHHHH